MSRHHEITTGEMHTYSEDLWTGDPQHSVETWVKCTCGWDAGTWGTEANDPEGLASIRRSRDTAIDEHMTADHRYSMRSSWTPDAVIS
jgi:hypothetical protein